MFNNHLKRYLPTQKLIKQACKYSILGNYKNISLSILIVDDKESQAYNQLYRDKNYPTNVISLEYPTIMEDFNNLIGEIILCDDIIIKEAKEQHKNLISHYLHMIIHGMLHIQGYDHQNDDDAHIMENLEIDILAKLGYQNPYNYEIVKS